MTRPFTHRAAATIILLNSQNEVCLMERTGTDSFVGDFCSAGGGAEPGESLQQTAIREMREEFGVEVAPENLEFLMALERPSAGGDYRMVEFFYLSRVWQGQPKNMEPHKHGNPEWYPLNALPARVSPWDKKALACIGKPGVEVVA